MKRPIDLIVIHCAATPNGRDDRVEGINAMHRARGFRRTQSFRNLKNPALDAIGYHYVVELDGSVKSGRHLEEVGAHAYGHNARSVGLCLIGTDAYTWNQWAGLKKTVDWLAAQYPKARICGHRDLSPDTDGDGVVERHEWLKTCPGFDVAAWDRGARLALAE